MQGNKADPSKHLGYLDAVRGIAAWMVVLFHFINWKYNEKGPAEWSFFIINGREAVSFFFVLSGFVLSYKYLQLRSPLNLQGFYINRVFRLFPAYFITILINFVYTRHVSFVPEVMSNLFLKNEGGFWEEALLIRRHSIYYPPGWTLNLELCASLLLPFAIVLYTTQKKLIGWLIFFCFLTGNSIIQMTFLHFLFGMLIAGTFQQWQKENLKERSIYRYRYLVLAGAFAIYSLRQINRVSPLGPSLLYVLDYLNFDFFTFSGIASAVFLIWFISSTRLQQLLSGRLLLFFGRISYGVYLMHWIVGQVIFDNWDNFWVIKIPNEALRLVTVLAIGIVATTILATIVHFLIERPMIKWGKHIGRRWKIADRNIVLET